MTSIEEWEQRHMTDDELVSLIGDLSEKECLEKTEISLYGNGTLTAIPPEIKRFKNLKILGVQGNKITYSKVAKELSELIHLETIYFASSLLGNSLIRIPLPLFNLVNLTDITLSKCKLKYVSPEIGKLVNLHRLTSLAELYLSDNKLPKQFMRTVNGHENVQTFLQKIHKYYYSREEKVKSVIVKYMIILKQVLHKDIVPLIGKRLWETRQNKSWLKVLKK